MIPTATPMPPKARADRSVSAVFRYKAGRPGAPLRRVQPRVAPETTVPRRPHAIHTRRSDPDPASLVLPRLVRDMRHAGQRPRGDGLRHQGPRSRQPRSSRRADRPPGPHRRSRDGHGRLLRPLQRDLAEPSSARASGCPRRPSRPASRATIASRTASNAASASRPARSSRATRATWTGGASGGERRSRSREGSIGTGSWRSPTIRREPGAATSRSNAPRRAPPNRRSGGAIHASAKASGDATAAIAHRQEVGVSEQSVERNGGRNEDRGGVLAGAADRLGRSPGPGDSAMGLHPQ